jgi:hypothetical protein
MNQSEYMKCKQIINLLFGCTITSIKIECENSDIDFITTEKMGDVNIYYTAPIIVSELTIE